MVRLSRSTNAVLICQPQAIGTPPLSAVCKNSIPLTKPILIDIGRRLRAVPTIPPAYGGRRSTSVQPSSSIHNLSLCGADNPSSRNQPPRFCLWTRRTVVPYKHRKALLSEPVTFLFIELVELSRKMLSSTRQEKCTLSLLFDGGCIMLIVLCIVRGNEVTNMT